MIRIQHVKNYFFLIIFKGLAILFSLLVYLITFQNHNPVGSKSYIYAEGICALSAIYCLSFFFFS